MASAAYAAADKLPTGLLHPNAETMSSYVVWQTAIAQSQTDQVAARFVIPFDFRLRRVDYAFSVTGNADLENIEVKIDGTAVSSAYDGPSSTAGVQSGSIPITLPMKEYARGSVITVEFDTESTTTVTDAAITIVVQPVAGG